MNCRGLQVPLYKITLLVSAFLLFVVQPMFGKMILPMLGGAPSVWNIAMVFFQTMLLAGYLYAHFLSRFSTKLQAAAHVVVLSIFALALPIAVPAGWVPPATDDPSLWQMRMMAVAVGGPFFALSATAPMLQQWFSRSGHERAANPYFLYAASNIGSLGALLGYSTIIEPNLSLHLQDVAWVAGYALLITLIAACAAISPNQGDAQASTAGPAAERLAPGRIVLWLALAFVPSSLMLGVTTFITTDVASVPLLWIIPLAIYVGTFIVAFAQKSPVKLGRALVLQGVLLAIVTGIIMTYIDNNILFMLLHLCLFGATALFCHMQLAESRPSARHLTAFYLTMSAGGVLGGMFNALIAPRLFTSPVEYPLVLGLSAFLRYATDQSRSLTALRMKLNGKGWLAGLALCIGIGVLCSRLVLVPPGSLRYIIALSVVAAMILLSRTRWVFALVCLAMLGTNPGYGWDVNHMIKLSKRNFFGIMRVVDRNGERLFLHGTTIHGEQPLDPAYRLKPVSYYSSLDFMTLLADRPGPQKIAVLGLGIGGISCYSRPGRHYDFYEIDPDVAVIAQDRKLFTYLSDCGSSYSVIIGDGRLKIAQAPDRSYDMIVLDAFNSDNVPVHLITEEAFRVYATKLKPGGFIAVDLSNRHLSLEPVIAANARDLDMRSLFNSRSGHLLKGTGIFVENTIFGVVAPQQDTIEPLLMMHWHTWEYDPSQKGWTDDFSNIFGAIRWKPPVADD